MTKWLLKRTKLKNENENDYRNQVGLLGGWGGLLTNFLLFVIKFFSGLFSGSISIMTDAINNLSDGASSLITIIGFKVSFIPADEEHPYGHARSEYISGLVVAGLIFVIGIQFLINSIKRIINPVPIEFSWTIVALLVFSIFMKLWQSTFYTKLGKEIDSTVLLATAVDSRSDVIITLTVLVSVLIQHYTGWLLDGPIGLLASAFVLYSGFEILKNTLSELLGPAPQRELVDLIYNKLNSYPCVLGAHDLIIHNYGPGAIYATAHVEISANQDILVSHDVADNIERDFMMLHDINLVIHVDPVVTDDPETTQWKERCEAIVKAIDPILTIHDFRMVKGITHSNLIFDMTVPPRYSLSNKELRSRVQQVISELEDTLYVVITIDRSYTSYVE